MRVGYAHVGPPEHGVRRYGQLLAAEAKRTRELEVIEAEGTFSRRRRTDLRMVNEIADRLAAADVVHLQYNRQYDKCLWGGGWSQLSFLQRFARRCLAPWVVTLHDIYPRQAIGTLARRMLARRGTDRERSGEARPRMGVPARVAHAALDTWGPHVTAVRRLLARADVVLVSSRTEARRLEAEDTDGKTRVVPHFVERRTLNTSPAEARTALGLSDRRVITLLGVIHPRKGHELLVDALPRLPADATVVFAGRPAVGGERFGDRLRARAVALGVESRLRITGYLAEEELDRYLVATHLAVCPFESLAASGSLSTWISAARPMLATDLPQMGEYNELEPGAVRTFAPRTPEALAAAVQALLPVCGDGDDPKVARLRKRLTISVILGEHLRHYRAAAESAGR